MCKLLVCGGREYQNQERADEVLTRFHMQDRISTLITGAATGADFLANKWAQRNFVNNEQYPAPWKKFGKAAGPIRNNQMLREGQPDCVIAFKGGIGTADMVRKALLAGLPVWEVDEDEEEYPDSNTND